MDAGTFIAELKQGLSALAYVEAVEIQYVEEEIIKARVQLQYSYYLMVRFNGYRFALSFALIFQNERIWGSDYDSPNGWHIHPLHHTTLHEPTQEKSMADILRIFDEVWQKSSINAFHFLLFSKLRQMQTKEVTLP